MHLNKLQVYFETSPALRLLRSPNAPFVLDFLTQQFKRGGRLTVVYSDLLAALKEYREDIHRQWPEVLREPAEIYLSAWCSDEARWLHRFLDSSQTEPVYELTSHTEDVIAFLDRVLREDLDFVGTESRLKIVIETLADLVVGASEDPKERLRHLRSEKQRIEDEIAAIENAGTVTRYRPAQIRERFGTAVSMLRQLQGDFRAVEERFKSITRQVQQRQHETDGARGGILSFALDSEELLKDEDQGVSFYEFVRFILSPAQQAKLQAVVQQLSHIEELTPLNDGLTTVDRMIPTLLAEAEKVMNTNRRLSTTLRRLLDTGAHKERQRVANLLGEIRGLAAAMSDDPPTDIGLEVETKIPLSSPLARNFWFEPPEFESVDLTEYVSDEAARADAFRDFTQLQRLDWNQMRDNVADVMSKAEMPTLGRVLYEHPPQSGIVEVLGYVQIAHDDGHMISVAATEEVVLPAKDETRASIAVTVPLIRFAAP